VYNTFKQCHVFEYAVQLWLVPTRLCQLDTSLDVFPNSQELELKN